MLSFVEENYIKLFIKYVKKIGYLLNKMELFINVVKQVQISIYSIKYVKVIQINDPLIYRNIFSDLGFYEKRFKQNLILCFTVRFQFSLVPLKIFEIIRRICKLLSCDELIRKTKIKIEWL